VLVGGLKRVRAHDGSLDLVWALDSGDGTVSGATWSSCRSQVDHGRHISYAIITAVLAGVFAGLVVLATVVLPVKTPVAVAAATLAAAALFNPLRKRVQHAVDRRFNRARYNAKAIVAAFTARLRQTVDLDTVQGDLVGVVHEAFQPAHVSVWLAGTWQQARALPGLRHPDLTRSG
jgi:Flp pilus assembly protein TadB